MKLLITILVLSSLHLTFSKRVICYHESSDFFSDKPLDADAVEFALPYCTHLIYGYVKIDGDSTWPYSKHRFDYRPFALSYEMRSFKDKNPELQVLLSVGDGRNMDKDFPNSIIDLLEAGKDEQQKFIDKIHQCISQQSLDGLDLAFQFPREQPKKSDYKLNWLQKLWQNIKRYFSAEPLVDPHADKHKQLFTEFVRNLNETLKEDGFLLTLTVLPNVNSTWYFDIPAIKDFFDFVTLAAFDFVTPARYPDIADYSSPFFNQSEKHPCSSHCNAEHQIDYWINHGFKSEKLNLGIQTYGNAWKITKESGKELIPPVFYADGPAPSLLHSMKPGVLNYADICLMVKNDDPEEENELTLKTLELVYKSNGAFAFQPVSRSVKEGIWISYEDDKSVTTKTMHASSKKLGGVAVFDISTDDYHGVCDGDRYPLLATIHKQVTQLIV